MKYSLVLSALLEYGSPCPFFAFHNFEFNNNAGEFLVVRSELNVISAVSRFSVGIYTIQVIHNRTNTENQPVIEVLVSIIKGTDGGKQHFLQMFLKLWNILFYDCLLDSNMAESRIYVKVERTMQTHLNLTFEVVF